MSQAEKTTAPQGAPSADAGLPMSPKWDPEKLAAEKAELRRLASLPLGPRSLGYVKRTGPGLLQSAMTLGAGSATASVLAGASFGYKLLWVQPLAMLLGVFMLGALSNVVLTRGERPYKSFGRQIWKPLVFLWAFGTVTASVIWHFPQYGLIAGAARDLAGAAGLTVAGEGGALTGTGYAVSFIAGALILAMNITVVFNYGKGATGVKIYERFLRTMIALVIFFFLLVCVLNVGRVDWLEVFKGFIGYYGIPKNADGVIETATYLQVLGMLGASVGINMTFLYPYSLLAKGWGSEHKTLARWDLGMTMFLPFVIVTSLIMIGMVATGVYDGVDGVRAGMKPLEAAAAFHGIPFGNVIFCLGLIGMCGGAVSVHMVACGFTMCEMLGLDMTQKRFRLFALTPCVGVLGVVVTLPMWFPVFASAICLTMLPIAYLIFFILNNKRSYLGDAVGKGGKRVFVNVMLTLALVFTTISAGISFKSAVYEKLFPKPTLAMLTTDATSLGQTGDYQAALAKINAAEAMILAEARAEQGRLAKEKTRFVDGAEQKLIAANETLKTRALAAVQQIKTELETLQDLEKAANAKIADAMKKADATDADAQITTTVAELQNAKANAANKFADATKALNAVADARKLLAKIESDWKKEAQKTKEAQTSTDAK